MIQLDIFTKSEPKLIHLANLWNMAESNPTFYTEMFTSNPHELAAMIQQGTTYHDWQEFLTDSRIQDYIDRNLYVQAGIIANKLMKETAKLSVSDATKLNSAIKYRDDHRPNFATPVQYIYIQTPLTADEAAFLPDVPENEKPGV